VADVEECEDDGDGRRVPKVRGQPRGVPVRAIRGWIESKKVSGWDLRVRCVGKGKGQKKWGAEVSVGNDGRKTTSTFF